MGGGFPLGRDVATGSTVSLPFSARFNGLYLVGKNGTGKSTVLARMVLADIAAGHGVCLLDPHGDLTTSILARYPADRQDDLILLDLKDHQHPFGLNIFWCPDPDDPYAVGQTVSRVMDVLGRIWNVSDETPRVAMVLRAVAATLAECRLTMAEIRPLLSDPIFRRNTVDQVRDEEARAFWRDFEKIPAGSLPMWTGSTMLRLSRFMAHPVVRAIVGQVENTVDWRRAMDESKVVLVRLDADQGEPTALIGATIVGQILDAALSRSDVPEKDRRPFLLTADEFQRFISQAFATLIEEARKFRIGTTMAHQRRDQLPLEFRKGPLGAGNLFVFEVHGDDARELAGQFDPAKAPTRSRDKRKPSMHAVEDLVRDGHSNEELRHLVAENLRPLVARIRNGGKQGYYGFTFSPIRDTHVSDTFVATKVGLERGLALVDQLLLRCMDGADPYEEVPLLVDIAVEFRGYFGLWHEAEQLIDRDPEYTGNRTMADSYRPNKLTETTLCGLRRFIEFLVAGLRSRLDFSEVLMPVLYQRCMASLVGVLEKQAEHDRQRGQPVDKYLSWHGEANQAYSTWRRLFEWWHGDAFTSLSPEERAEFMERTCREALRRFSGWPVSGIYKEVTAFSETVSPVGDWLSPNKFVSWVYRLHSWLGIMIRLGELLRDHPIPEPRGTRAEVVTQLATMPEYHARVKMRSEAKIVEHVVAFFPDEVKPAAKPIRPAVIGRSLRDVQADIRLRQQPVFFDEPPPI